MFITLCAVRMRVGAKLARFKHRELRGRLWHAAAFKTLEQAGSAIAVEVRYDADWLIVLHSGVGVDDRAYRTHTFHKVIFYFYGFTHCS